MKKALNMEVSVKSVEHGGGGEESVEHGGGGEESVEYGVDMVYIVLVVFKSRNMM